MNNKILKFGTPYFNYVKGLSVPDRIAELRDYYKDASSLILKAESDGVFVCVKINGDVWFVTGSFIKAEDIIKQLQ